MNKVAKIKLENWILDQLKIEPLDYYQLLNRADWSIAPSDISIRLQVLVASDQVLRMRDTPNPTYQLQDE
jgi:hypothetical protein